MVRPDQTAVKAGFLTQLRGGIRRRLVPHRHTALLAALIVVFLVRPFTGDSGAGPPLMSVAMLLLLLLALYNIDVDELVGDRETLLAQRRRRSIIAWTLGVPAVVERLVTLFAPTHKLFLGGTGLWLVLFAYITWNELRAVLKQREVTREVISMSISTYLLLGFTCGLFYIVLHDLQPNSFRHHSRNSAGPVRSRSRGNHRTVLPCDPCRASGRNADEPISRSGRGTKDARFRHEKIIRLG
jgi:hypothetical protein